MQKIWKHMQSSQCKWELNSWDCMSAGSSDCFCIKLSNWSGKNKQSSRADSEIDVHTKKLRHIFWWPQASTLEMEDERCVLSSIKAVFPCSPHQRFASPAARINKGETSGQHQSDPKDLQKAHVHRDFRSHCRHCLCPFFGWVFSRFEHFLTVWCNLQFSKNENILDKFCPQYPVVSLCGMIPQGNQTLVWLLVHDVGVIWWQDINWSEKCCIRLEQKCPIAVSVRGEEVLWKLEIFSVEYADHFCAVMWWKVPLQ